MNGQAKRVNAELENVFAQLKRMAILQPLPE